MTQAAVDILTMLAVIVGTCVVLALWDRIADRVLDDHARAVDDPDARPMQQWRS